MASDYISDQIFDLEQQLLKPEVRQSAERIAELLSDDFTEFCSSGTVYHYRKGDVFEQNNMPIPKWGIFDFSTKLLSDDVILATYKSVKYSEKEEMKYSLRSSIWKNFNGKWKMIFHQGTLA